MSAAGDALVQVRDLHVHFPIAAKKLGAPPQQLRAVDGVSFDLHRGETLGLVGESGCGKSTTGRAVLQLSRPTSGSVRFDGVELTALWRRRFGSYRWGPELRALRQRMQMVFQDPYASLNPRMTVEAIIAEPLRTFGVDGGASPRSRVQSLMERVGMDPRFIRRYPHEFSGGQRQRIGIARALALSPELLICDEPISALDVSIQAQILNLLRELQRDLGLTYLFIAHDLSAVRHISDRIAVMYLGRVVEVASADALVRAPRHPYSKALISAVPIADPEVQRARRRLPLVGEVPSPLHPPTGCPFHTRCPDVIDVCRTDVPALRSDTAGAVACHRVELASAPR